MDRKMQQTKRALGDMGEVKHMTAGLLVRNNIHSLNYSYVQRLAKDTKISGKRQQDKRKKEKYIAYDKK